MASIQAVLAVGQIKYFSDLVYSQFPQIVVLDSINKHEQT